MPLELSSTCGATGRSGIRDWRKIIIAKEPKVEQKVSDYVSTNYSEDSLLVWGNSCYIYNSNDKFSPITFFYQSTFKYNTDLIKNKIDNFVKQIREKKPELIVDMKRNGFLELDASNAAEIDEDQKNNLKQFIQLVEDQYVLKEQRFGVDFYKLKRNE